MGVSLYSKGNSRKDEALDWLEAAVELAVRGLSHGDDSHQSHSERNTVLLPRKTLCIGQNKIWVLFVSLQSFSSCLLSMLNLRWPWVQQNKEVFFLVVGKLVVSGRRIKCHLHFFIFLVFLPPSKSLQT